MFQRIVELSFFENELLTMFKRKMCLQRYIHQHDDNGQVEGGGEGALPLCVKKIFRGAFDQVHPKDLI